MVFSENGVIHENHQLSTHATHMRDSYLKDYDEVDILSLFHCFPDFSNVSNIDNWVVLLKENVNHFDVGFDSHYDEDSGRSERVLRILLDNALGTHYANRGQVAVIPESVYQAK